MMPAGYHFLPTTQEVIHNYLKRKVNGERLPYDAVKELDPFKKVPWEMFNEKSVRQSYVFTKMKKKDMQWDERTIGTGTWVFGDMEEITDINGKIIGYVRDFHFFMTSGAPYHGDWVMHQFSLPDNDYPGDEQTEEYVICGFMNSDMDPELQKLLKLNECSDDSSDSLAHSS